jgi:hypothetical protein
LTGPRCCESYLGVLSRADADLTIARALRPRWGRAASWLACASLLLGISRVAVAAPGLTVETGSPDALCPDLATTRAAVERRLGQLIVADGSSFTARYTIGHAPSGTPRDFVRLELFGPDGNVQLARDLPLDGESCSTMADVIALVLDRHFRALLGREPASEAPLEPEPAAPPSPLPPPMSPEPTPTPADRGASQVDARAQGARRAPVSLSLELAAREARHPALGGRALLSTWPEGLVGLAVHVSLSQDSEAVGEGEVKSRESVARAFVAWAPRLGPLDAYLGPGLRLSLARATAGDLATSLSGLRLSPSFGVDAGLAWHPEPRWVLSAFTALDVMVPRMGGWFSVDGREVLEPPPVRVWLGIGVGYSP